MYFQWGKLQFPAHKPLPLYDVDKIMVVGVFHYADLKYN